MASRWQKIHTVSPWCHECWSAVIQPNKRSSSSQSPPSCVNTLWAKLMWVACIAGQAEDCCSSFWHLAVELNHRLSIKDHELDFFPAASIQGDLDIVCCKGDTTNPFGWHGYPLRCLTQQQHINSSANKTNNKKFISAKFQMQHQMCFLSGSPGWFPQCRDEVLPKAEDWCCMEKTEVWLWAGAECYWLSITEGMYITRTVEGVNHAIRELQNKLLHLST